ncbi:MAG: hypothetical protein ACI9WT_001833, partial [Flavobacterium sp.]
PKPFEPMINSVVELFDSRPLSFPFLLQTIPLITNDHLNLKL